MANLANLPQLAKIWRAALRAVCAANLAEVCGFFRRKALLDCGLTAAVDLARRSPPSVKFRSGSAFFAATSTPYLETTLVGVQGRPIVVKIVVYEGQFTSCILRGGKKCFCSLQYVVV